MHKRAPNRGLPSANANDLGHLTGMHWSQQQARRTGTSPGPGTQALETRFDPTNILRPEGPAHWDFILIAIPEPSTLAGKLSGPSGRRKVHDLSVGVRQSKFTHIADKPSGPTDRSFPRPRLCDPHINPFPLPPNNRDPCPVAIHRTMGRGVQARLIDRFPRGSSCAAIRSCAPDTRVARSRRRRRAPTR